MHKKSGSCFFVFWLLGVLLVLPIVAKSESTINVNLTIKDTPFSETADLVARQIDYNIKFEKTLQDVAVSGRFKNVPVENFFHRILKGKNIIIDINEKKREILIKNFGSKTGKLLVAKRINGKSSSHGFVDPVTGKTMKELNKIYALQEQNRENRLRNPNTIDPMTGKTMGELKMILKKQNDNYQKRQTSPYAIDPVTGKKNVEMNQVVEQQKESRAARLSDPNAIDPMTGKTFAELNEIFLLQEQKRRARLNNPNAIDPMTGKTMAEINAILLQQEENWQKRNR